MVVVFTITEINYLLASLFCDLERPVRIHICGMKFFGCAICLVSGIATKTAMPSPTLCTIS